MTPEEQAKKLILKMQWELPPRFFGEASRCAQITVDTILEELDHTAFDDPDYGTSKMEYWTEVKQEIKKVKINY
jgi:hypothetical protein